ncbi:MAG: S9 family peptidase [Bdellovibrionaceae bacterium]|nr:S9 family peptidase [Pseudobdellovibrionaceae bacterium]|tara:strand:+ start:156514 stop:158457 length:1944 start_codon:yes stop_codon:yes gene_type:complete
MRILGIILLGVGLISCSHNQKNGYSGHGAESVSPNILEKFAPKPLPSSDIARIESMLDVRSPGLGMLSPDGKNLFFTWSVTGTRQVWRITKNSRFPVQMTGGQDSTNIQAITSDGKYLIVSRDEKGNEYPFMYIQPTSGGPLELLAGKKKVITNFQFLSKDSRYLYYTMNATNPTQHDLFKMDLKSRTSIKLMDGIKGYMWVADHRPNGDLLLANAKGNTAREVFLFNEASGKLTPIIGQDEMEQYSVQFARNPGEYIVRTNKFGEYHRLYILKNGKFDPITPVMSYNIEDFSIDENRTRVLYSVNRDGYSEVNAMNARNYKAMNLPFKRSKGVLHTYAGSTTPNSRYTVFGVSKSQSPRASYVYDWRTGKKDQWVVPSSPEVDTSKFVEPSLEHYVARDGTKIPMFVMRPKQCTNNVNCPVIVSFHGGPEAQARPNFSPYQQLFMEAGFIYVQPNVRGSAGYSKSWLNSDNGPKRLKVITDIEDASLYIKKHWAVNGLPPKIGVMGGSYGGYSTNVAMTMFAGAYSAGASIVGMSSLVTFLENTGPYRRHLRVTEYGDPEKDLEALKKLSPVTYLDRIQDPLLIVHGATDPRVPAGEAIQFYEAMEKKGLDGELVLFADEGHGIRKRKNRAIYIGRILEFFKKHLK